MVGRVSVRRAAAAGGGGGTGKRKKCSVVRGGRNGGGGGNQSRRRMRGDCHSHVAATKDRKTIEECLLPLLLIHTYE